VHTLEFEGVGLVDAFACTVAEAADLMGISRSAVYKAVTAGRLKTLWFRHVLRVLVVFDGVPPARLVLEGHILVERMGRDLWVLR
jgi:excisionase family DNA binding protein